MPRKNIVGPHVRTARKRLKITQSALATQLQLLGVRIDRSAIAKIETDRRPVSDVEVAALAKVLMTDVASLFEDGPDDTR